MSHPNKKNHTKHKRISKIGMSPGAPIYTGNNIHDTPTIQLVAYDEAKADFYDLDINELLAFETDKKIWLNIIGLNHTDIIQKICDKYGIHHLYQEDVMNVFQRPKVVEEDQYIYVTFKSMEWSDTCNEIIDEQMSIFLLENTVIMFQEKKGDCFDPIREKLRAPQTLFRERTIDFLFYRVLDISVDSYFEIVEKMSDYLDVLENEAVLPQKSDYLQKIQDNKKTLMKVRKYIFPLRDIFSKLTQSDHQLLDFRTKKYFTDVQDHTLQIYETVDAYREYNTNIKEIYLNTMSNEMNKIMKTLTIISTIFIPLTFLVGVYGMNFQYMPELGWKKGYYLVWAVMILTSLALVFWFKRKKWI